MKDKFWTIIFAVAIAVVFVAGLFAFIALCQFAFTMFTQFILQGG